MSDLKRAYSLVRAVLDRAGTGADSAVWLRRLKADERAHSAYTADHADRVGFYVERLALALGKGRADAAALGAAARLHDVGKSRMARELLYPAGPFTRAMHARIKHHTLIGARLLLRHPGPAGRLAADMALHHHERMDGKGYFGLKGDDIPESARLCAIADVFDALTGYRPYRPPISVSAALSLMARAEASEGICAAAFDPAMLAAFIRHAPAFAADLARHPPGRARLDRDGLKR